MAFLQQPLEEDQSELVAVRVISLTTKLFALSNPIDNIRQLVIELVNIFCKRLGHTF